MRMQRGKVTESTNHYKRHMLLEGVEIGGTYGTQIASAILIVSTQILTWKL